MLSGQQTDDIAGEKRPPVKRLVIGKSTAALNPGDPINLSWKVPAGYKKVTGIYFNPDPNREAIFDLYSENVVYNVVQGFDTAVGTALGFMNPLHDYAENDQLSLQGTTQPNWVGGSKFTVSLQFE